MQKVLAKFNCQFVDENKYSKQATLNAVYSTSGENKDFTDATPYGKLEIMIMNDAPASEFFTPGEDYYLTFSKID